MARAAIPTGYRNIPETSFYQWDSADEGSGKVVNYGTGYDATYNNLYTLDGTTSLQLTTGSGEIAITDIALSGVGLTIPTTRPNRWRFAFYIENVLDIGSIKIRFGVDGTYAARWQKLLSHTAYDTDDATTNTNGVLTSLHDGWNIVDIEESDMTKTGSPTWATITRMDISVAANTARTAVVHFASITNEGYARPKVLISFDDGINSAYINALPILRNAGLPSTWYVSRQYSDYDVRADDGSYISEAEIKAMPDNTHIGIHGHIWPDESTTSALLTEIKAEMDWLKSLGFTPEHCAYTQGRHDKWIYSAVAQSGLKSARTQKGGNLLATNNRVCFTCRNSWLRQGGTLTPPNDATSAEVISQIDKAITLGGAFELVFHAINTLTGGADAFYGTDEFQEVVDHIVDMKNKGVIDVVNKKQLYDGA